MSDFDPFAGGLATEAEPKAPAQPSGSNFDPFASGAASQVAPAEQQTPDWKNLFAGIDEAHNHMDGATRKAYATLSAATDNDKETQAQGINQAYVRSRLPQWTTQSIQQNWPAVKDAFAKNALGINTSGISDTSLYQAIGEAEKAKQAHVGEEYQAASPFKKLQMLGPLFSAYAGQRLSDNWDTANKPFVKLPTAELPDVPGMGINNPALVGGVWNAAKPVIEGIESPFGVATIAAGPVLKGLPYAKQVLAGIGGIFTGLMAKHSYEAAKAAPAILQDPKATTQDKVTAVAEPIISGAMALLAGFHTVKEALPEKAATQLAKDLKGTTPEQAANVLRASASKQTSLEAVGSMHAQADALEGLSEKALEKAAEPVEPPKPGEAEKAPEPRKGPATIQALEGGAFVVTDADGKLIDFASNEAEAQNIASGATEPKTESLAGPRDQTISDGSGTPTAHEEQMLSDWKKAIEEETGQKGGAEKLTGIKNAAIDAQLSEMGLPPATHGEALSWEQAASHAAAAIEEDPTAGERLVSELDRKPRAVSGREDALLLHEQNRLRLERDMAEKQLIEAKNQGDPADLAEAQARVAKARDDYARAADVATKVGTENAQGLALRRMMMKEDYSLAAMEQRRVAAKGGEPLTPKETAQIKDLQQKLSDAQKEFDEYRAAQERKRPTRARPVPGRVAEKLSELAVDARARIAERSKAMGGRLFSGIDPTDIPAHVANLIDLSIIGAEHLARGVTKFADWSAEMVKEFGESVKPHLPDVFERAQNLGTEENLKAALEKKQKALQTQIKRLSQKLETGDLSPEPTLAGRPQVKEIETLTQTRDALREELTRAREKQAKVAELEHAIREKEIAIAAGDTAPEGQPLNRPAEDGVEQLKQQRDSLNEKLAEMRKEAGKPTEADTLQKKVEALDKRILEKKSQIASGDVAPDGQQSNRPMVKELEERHQELSDLNKQIEQMRKGPPKDPEVSRLEAFKRRTAKSIEAYNEQLATGDFSKTEKPKPLALDAEALRLKAEVERVKRDVEQAEMRQELSNRSTPEKIRDAFIKWVREGALSYPTVIAKLTGAAIARMVTTPLEQGVGYGLSKLLPDLAEAAPREGVPSFTGAIKAEVKAFTEGTIAGIKNAKDLLKGKDTDKQVLFEKNHLPPTLADYLGKLHAALKEPVKMQEFTRSLELRTQHALEHGIDPRDPIQQLRLMNEAYMDAKRSIFMQDNVVVEAFKNAIRTLEATNKQTGKPSAAGLFLSTVMQTELPIVKVPTNVITEASQIIGGSLVGPVKAAWAYAKGIENLKPAEADAILRLMKKGLPGLALMAIGFFKAKEVGGFYQKGEKRKSSDVPAGDVRIGGAEIPHQLLHNSYAMALDFGATINRAATQRLGGSEQHDLGHGLLAASIGLVEDVPFLRETSTMAKYLDPKQSGNALSAKAASILVPGGLQWTAAQLDKNSPFSPFETPTPRKAKGLVQDLKKATPGLRQELPKGK